MSIDILSELTRDLEKASRGLADSAMIERGSKWVEQLKRENPIFHSFIKSVLYEEPHKVLVALAVLDHRLAPLIRNEYALKYVEMIQAQLRGQPRGPSQKKVPNG